MTKLFSVVVADGVDAKGKFVNRKEYKGFASRSDASKFASGLTGKEYVDIGEYYDDAVSESAVCGPRVLCD